MRYDNIEYRPFPGKTYRVGYARLSGVWHIYKMKDGYYVKKASSIGGHQAFHAQTLLEGSDRLNTC